MAGKLRNYFAPDAKEEYRPVIVTRQDINNSLTKCSQLLPHLTAEKRKPLIEVIEALADAYRFLDNIHTAYMAEHEV